MKRLLIFGLLALASAPALALDVPMGNWTDQETSAAKALFDVAEKAQGHVVAGTAEFLINKIEAAEKAAATPKPAADPAPASKDTPK